MLQKILIYILLLSLTCARGSNIPFDRIPSNEEVLNYLDQDNPELKDILLSRDAGEISEAIVQLTLYLKEKISTRYYFNWKYFNQRFKYYSETFPDAMEEHAKQAQYQKSTFSAKTSWELPFKNLKNEDVTAYELRHLARQQKSSDMAIMYFSGQESDNLDYFVTQVADLNNAFTEGAYDDAGNGVYETYRGGRRIHNWLFCHNAYLSSEEYDFEDQLLLIKTFLHHGAQLYKRTATNRYGNHHTKGLVALFEIATLFPEFVDLKEWKNQAIAGLVWHIENEINSDGFQFERSVHYHKGDIENYFRVYQLANINQVALSPSYIQQFRRMFDSLVQLAQPNKRLPVLQDDTDRPFAENNQMDDALTIGTIMFRDSVFRYFSTNKVPGSIYWLLKNNQLNILKEITKETPQIGSTELEQTGYYIMRDGWKESDMYLTVTAGLSEHKPDHQHGDMMGIVAYANGHEILPNYQVRYKFPDYIFWKNSWVKNVALVDSIPQGRQWKQNSGKSGFGKWLYLPEPKTISWIKENNFDHYIGTHSGFDSINVTYYREVIFLHNNFWIVCDYFESEDIHTYQQVWQGDYKISSNSTIEKTYSDNSGLIIEQIIDQDYKIESGQYRDKHNSVFSVVKTGEHSFITLLKPYKQSDSEQKVPNTSCLTENKWLMMKSAPNIDTDASIILTNLNRIILVNSTYFNHPKVAIKIDTPATFLLDIGSDSAEITYLGRKTATIIQWHKNKLPDEKTGGKFDPGERITLGI
jgi:hypothetical protein